MNKLFNRTDSAMVFDIVDELHEELVKKCERYSDNYCTIYVALDISINLEDFSLKNAINKGFAACSSNYPYNDGYVRLIVINANACMNSEITNDEYKALILHELGHLLDSPIFEEEPSEWYCIKNRINYDKERQEEIKNLNSQNDEIHADYYAKSFGYGVQLRSIFTKHEQQFNEPVRFKELRIEKINSVEVFNGNVKPIVPFT